MGHNLALPYAEPFWSIQRKDLPVLIVGKKFCVGLVGKEHESYAEASFDFKAVATIEN